MTEEELLMQEAQQASSFMAKNAHKAVEHKDVMTEALENKSLDKSMIRNFWFTRNHESISAFESLHSEKNAEEYYKHFSNFVNASNIDVGKAESVGYRNLLATHKAEMAKSADMPRLEFAMLEKQHEVELVLFDVRKEQLNGNAEPDMTEVNELYEQYDGIRDRYQKSLERQSRRDENDKKASLKKETSSEVEVMQIDPNYLETILRVNAQMNSTKLGMNIARMRNNSKRD